MSRDPIETARMLAANHPASKLPCPVCVQVVNATNLDGHLAKVHDGAKAARPPWRGRDRRVVIGATVAAIAGTILALVITNVTSIRPNTTAALLVMALGIVPAGIALAGLFDTMRASVTVDGDAIVLSHSFGLGRRRVTLPCSIETGSLFESRTSALANDHEFNQPSYEVRAGSYLRLSNGRRGITIAMKGDSGFRKTWNRGDWNAGERRRWYDIKVPREALVAIEYALAARGQLVPASAPAATTA